MVRSKVWRSLYHGARDALVTPGGCDEELQWTWRGSSLNDATCPIIMANPSESSQEDNKATGDMIIHGKGRLVRGGYHDVDMWLKWGNLDPLFHWVRSKG